MSGPTAAATLEISVHGVVVQTSRSAVAAVRRQREAHVDRRVDDVAVALGHLVGRERGAAAGAVGRDPVALVEQALVPQLAHQPPHRLDVVVGQRPVGVLGVDPGAGPRGERRPVLDVAVHRLAAALVELGDAVRLDLVLGVQAELLLDLELDRQAVAVPAALAGHVAAPHGLEAGVEVLEHPGPHVVEAGPAVGGRRALVEDPRLAVLAERCATCPTTSSLAPAGEDARLERDEVERGSTGPNGMGSVVAA